MSMSRIVEIISKLKNDPKIVFDRLYYLVTGIRVREMRNERDNYAGTLSALAILSDIWTGRKIEHRDLIQITGDSAQKKDCEDLGKLFALHGSDKSTKHNYHLVYSAVLKGKRALPLKILEIGIGTNNPSIPSSMGKYGKPGASLRAFRDWGPNCIMYGADIDKDVLFSEDRISTFFVDQTNLESLNTLARKFPERNFDLIIDDGLHNTWANLNTLIFALDLLKTGGSFVVEDINEASVPVWKMVLSLMEKNYDCQFLKAKAESVCIIRRLA